MIVNNDQNFTTRYERYIEAVRMYDSLFDNEPLTNYLINGGYFTSPASTKYHGVYPGGLFDHSYAVARRLNWMTEELNLKWMRPESPLIVGLFHDLCKCDQYKEVDAPVQLQLPDGSMSMAPVMQKTYEYNTNTLLNGHGEKSVMILSRFMTLTEEEMLCIRYHMGPYEKEAWDQFDMAIHKFENVYFSHAADMLASKVDNT